jgi:flagellar hook-associated protein FlgK
MNGLTSEIQAMRREADRDVSDTVNLINTKLNTINDLNKQISLALGQQQSAADLKDARDLVLAQLSELIEIETYDRSSGHVVLFTNSAARWWTTASYRLPTTRLPSSMPRSAIPAISAGSIMVRAQSTSRAKSPADAWLA